MNNLIKEEYDNGWKLPEEIKIDVLSSANKLFLKIQNCFQRCVRYISKGEPLYLLSKAFQVINSFLHALINLMKECVKWLCLGIDKAFTKDVRRPDEFQHKFHI